MNKKSRSTVLGIPLGILSIGTLIIGIGCVAQMFGLQIPGVHNVDSSNSWSWFFAALMVLGSGIGVAIPGILMRSVEGTESEIIQHRWIFPDVVIAWKDVTKATLTPWTIKIYSSNSKGVKKVEVNHLLYNTEERKAAIEFVKQRIPEGVILELNEI